MTTKESILLRSAEIRDQAHKSKITFLALTGSVNKETNRTDSDIDFVFDYDRNHFSSRELFSFQNWLEDTFGTHVHLLSLWASDPAVLLSIGDNHEVIVRYEK